MRNTLFASVAVGAISFSGAASATTPLNIPVNQNPLGPEFIITFGTGGAISTALNSAYSSDPGPYDGVEDTYFGVINNSGSQISSFNLSAPGIGGFDGDGIGLYAAIGSNATDTSSGKYGGPNAFFTNNLINSLTVNFINAIPGNGGTDVFSLEEKVSLNNIVVTPGVPEPSTWAMMLLGFAGLGFAALRRNKKTGSAVAAA
jgi:hypothetical protein